jgi:hypothetical protein
MPGFPNRGLPIFSENEVNKDQAKLLILSILGTVRIIFGVSPKARFVLDILTDLILEKWDEGWDTYHAKRKGLKGAPPAGVGSVDDPADDLLKVLGG